MRRIRSFFCWRGTRITHFGAGARLDIAGGRERSGVVEKKPISRVRAFAPLLASGANTVSAARVPRAIGLTTENSAAWWIARAVAARINGG